MFLSGSQSHRQPSDDVVGPQREDEPDDTEGDASQRQLSDRPHPFTRGGDPGQDENEPDRPGHPGGSPVDGAVSSHHCNALLSPQPTSLSWPWSRYGTVTARAASRPTDTPAAE